MGRANRQADEIFYGDVVEDKNAAPEEGRQLSAQDAKSWQIAEKIFREIQRGENPEEPFPFYFMTRQSKSNKQFLYANISSDSGGKPVFTLRWYDEQGGLISDEPRAIIYSGHSLKELAYLASKWLQDEGEQEVSSKDLHNALEKRYQKFLAAE